MGDVSHNNITGSLPLTELSKMPKLRYLSMHHNMLDEVCYHGGGFPELERLSIIYNRNMTGLFPRGLGELPSSAWRCTTHTFEVRCRRAHGRACSFCSSPGPVGFAARSRQGVPKRMCTAISRQGCFPLARLSGQCEQSASALGF